MATTRVREAVRRAGVSLGTVSSLLKQETTQHGTNHQYQPVMFQPELVGTWSRCPARGAAGPGPVI